MRPAASTDAPTAGLARLTAELRFEHLPPEVVACARATLLDTLGAMLAASAPSYPIGDRLLAALTPALSQGVRAGVRAGATVVGRGVALAPAEAALVNGTLAYYCDLETLHAGAIMHGAAVVVPAALAAAEVRPAGGPDLLAALVLGVDVACRVSYAIGPNALYARGFHPTAVAGAFGATAAAGWLLRLDPERQAVAYGLTAAQASGLLAWASDHSEESRPFNAGVAARNGVTAALLAAAGFGGPTDVLDPDATYGVYRAWSDRPAPEALADRWGERFCLTEAAFKRYACCGFLHPALDALMALRNSGRVTPDQAEAITLRFAPSGAHMIDGHPLRSHCAQYILPLGLLRGRVQLDDLLTDRRAADARLADLSTRTTVVTDADLELCYPERYASIVEVALADGRIERERVDWPRGYPQNPLTADELHAKFLDLASPVLGPAGAQRLAEIVSRLDAAPDLTALLAQLGRPRP